MTMKYNHTMHILAVLLLASTTPPPLRAAVLNDSLQSPLKSTGISTHETAEDNNIDMETESEKPEMESAFDFGTDDEAERYSGRIVVSDATELNNRMINHQQFHFLLNAKDGCPSDVFVLALIKTSPHKFIERQDIRKTWGSVKEHKGHRIVPLFTMGKLFLPNTSVIENELLKESVKYGDIIQGEFNDHHKNKTYKSIMGLTWAKTFCNQADFILNTDDDTIVDIYHLVDFLQQNTKTEDTSQNFLYCSTFFDQGPVRNPVDKDYITINEYPYDKFPPHCEGFGYILSKDVSEKLLDAAKSVPFLWLDDVFTTGFLALKAGVQHCDMMDGHSYKFMQKSQIKAGVQDAMFFVAKYKQLRKNWDTTWKAIQTANVQ